ncbi:Y-box-binding protein 1-like [Thalassophryne amazonica]|uniref:Y-box-binding protein 1-like n=1 Tax=Thalassophryne amazonica TaxID=390379 RepID=UPI001470ED96|nr:Y-box-binding protein 1-like [Thalassophryne amazonica]
MSMEPKTQQADETMKTQSKQTAAASRGPKMIKTKVVGKIKWFSEKDGYGFITRRDKAEDVFFHYTAINKNADGQICIVKEEQKVQFDIVEGRKGPMAVNITSRGGLPIQGSKYTPPAPPFSYE